MLGLEDIPHTHACKHTQTHTQALPWGWERCGERGMNDAWMDEGGRSVGGGAAGPCMGVAPWWGADVLHNGPSMWQLALGLDSTDTHTHTHTHRHKHTNTRTHVNTQVYMNLYDNINSNAHARTHLSVTLSRVNAHVQTHMHSRTFDIRTCKQRTTDLYTNVHFNT